ncbi:hypothetical protein EDB85DRAFT_1267512 [Lactarius pseudohatsudake]|nr:hypothetical protein EDB85DRAFT_1267512 [Lactarius pseudohatsudake]
MRKNQGDHSKKTFRATRTRRTLRASLAPSETSSAVNDSTVCTSVAPRCAPSETSSAVNDCTEVDCVLHTAMRLPGQATLHAGLTPKTELGNKRSQNGEQTPIVFAPLSRSDPMSDTVTPGCISESGERNTTGRDCVRHGVAAREGGKHNRGLLAVL